jgi:hypothetical protein
VRYACQLNAQNACLVISTMGLIVLRTVVMVNIQIVTVDSAWFVSLIALLAQAITIHAQVAIQELSFWAQVVSQSVLM